MDIRTDLKWYVMATELVQATTRESKWIYRASTVEQIQEKDLTYTTNYLLVDSKYKDTPDDAINAFKDYAKKVGIKEYEITYHPKIDKEEKSVAKTQPNDVKSKKKPTKKKITKKKAKKKAKKTKRKTS